ncbi:TPA: glutamyl-tRNA amidotransferase [Patescibacteria group bacterium]|nr:MAG: hypothetical protein UU98_C0009G0005 [Parcubacteria group bacterium GW2011_GWD2_42_14]HCC05111.1 glutamyl-tRNA amidotransferase [Patescibacteria group bacterium]
MTLQQKVRADMVEAMKAKEEVRLRVLRSLLTLFTNELTATKRTPQDSLTDEEVLGLIRRSVKQRVEAATQFRSGKREDLAENEEAEAKVLEAYLPAMMSKEDILKMVKAKMEEMKVVDKSGMGRLMGAVMLELKGKADGKDVKEVIEQALN